MYKLLSLLLTAAILLTLTSCGKLRKKVTPVKDSSNNLTAAVSSPASSDKEDVSSVESNTESSDVSSAETGSEDQSSSVQSTVSDSEPEPCRHNRTYVRNKKDATESAEGYTGDTYCSDCGTLISRGKTVQKLQSSVPSPSHTPSSPATSTELEKYEQEMFRQLNKMRAEAGLDALTWNDEVYVYTKIRANEAVDFFQNGQTGHDGDPHNRMYNGKWSSPFTVFEEYGYPNGITCGENLAYTAMTHFNYNAVSHVTVLMNGLYNSQGHRENMLNPDFTTVAIAFVECTDSNGWHGVIVVQMFYTPAG